MTTFRIATTQQNNDNQYNGTQNKDIQRNTMHNVEIKPRGLRIVMPSVVKLSVMAAFLHAVAWKGGH